MAHRPTRRGLARWVLPAAACLLIVAQVPLGLNARAVRQQRRAAMLRHNLRLLGRTIMQYTDEHEFFSPYRLVAVDNHGCRVRCDAAARPALDWPRLALPALDCGGRPQPDWYLAPTVALRRSPTLRYLALPHPRDLPMYCPPAEARWAPTREYRVPSPDPVEFPTWKPEPYPVRRGSSALTIALTGLSHRLRAEKGVLTTRARFRYRESGRATDGWRADRVTVEDATGNTLQSDNGCWSSNQIAEFDGLCRRETAWKITADFARTHLERANADFVWTARNVPAPRRDSVCDVGLTGSGNGIHVRLLRMTGGDVRWATGSGPPRSPCVTMQAGAPDSRLQVKLVGAADERGRNLLQRTKSGLFWRGSDEGAPAGWVLAGSEDDVELAYPPRTRRLNLTFAIHRLRTVTFLAKP